MDNQELINIANKALAKYSQPELEESKKKKKDCDSVTYTTGNIGLNIDHFNKALSGSVKLPTDGMLSGTFGTHDTAKACEKAGTFAAPSPDGASSVSYSASGESGGGESCCEDLELDEDTIYVGKLKQELDLPKKLKLIPQDQVESTIDELKPEEKFDIGYVNPVYIYKELWNLMPIYKCTEMEGYTGVDFGDSGDIKKVDGAEARRKLAQTQIDTAKAGLPVNYKSDASYSSQNKLVHRSTTFDPSGKIKTDRNTILFYPIYVVRVVYFVRLPEQTEFIAIDDATLEKVIYDNLHLIEKKFDMDTWHKKIHTTIFGQDDIELDRETRTDTVFNGQFIHKYGEVKPNVRSLYTTQVYFLKTSIRTLGKELTLDTDVNYDVGYDDNGNEIYLDDNGQPITEAKRYVRRYYIRPQDIFCSNKAEILKALIDHQDENLTIYTLNNLGDEKDTAKLTNDDIIYYYDDGILYDKNHVRVMDYDLYIKHEENRDEINPDAVSDKTFQDVYDDRMTDQTELEEGKKLEESSWVLDSTKYEDGYYLEYEWEKCEGYVVTGGFEINGVVYNDMRRVYGDKESAARAYRRYRKQHSMESPIKSEEQADIEYEEPNELIDEAVKPEDGFDEFDDSNFEDVDADDAFGLEFDNVDAYGEKQPRISTASYRAIDDGHVDYEYAYTKMDRFIDCNDPDEFEKFYSIRTVDEMEEFLKANIDEDAFMDRAGDGATLRGFAEYIINNRLNDLDESLHEGKEELCCICGEPIKGYGNNAEPYKSGRCCDACNLKFVIPARMDQMRSDSKKSEEK